MNRVIPHGAALLLAFIRKIEVGRDDRASYDVIYNNKQDRLLKPLTSMTYGEIIDARVKWSKTFGSNAAGGYQCIRTTLIDFAKANPSISGNDPFTPSLQDQCGFALLLYRAYGHADQGRRRGTCNVGVTHKHRSVAARPLDSAVFR